MFLKKLTSILLVLTFLVLVSCTQQLKTTKVTAVNTKDIIKHPYSAGLFLTKELKDYVYELQTSPFDKIAYPLGKQTCDNFTKNLPLVFDKIILVDSLEPNENISVIIKPSILDFNLGIPIPAYNPHTAKIKYNIDVYNNKGEKIFNYEVTGSAQSGKGLMSGFHTKKICSEVTQMALKDGIKQIIEELSDTEELDNLK